MKTGRANHRIRVYFDNIGEQSVQGLSFTLDGYDIKYVENIAHTTLLAHPYPLSILIVGGSQKDPEVQAILTEVFRYKTIKRVAVIESLQDKNPTSLKNISATVLVHRQQKEWKLFHLLSVYNCY
jgi:hypothetical protein